jgi:hypothetical protein
MQEEGEIGTRNEVSREWRKLQNEKLYRMIEPITVG